jgi:hypothetical protein
MMMRTFCRLFDHSVRPSQVTINGVYFSNCRRCDLHMIKWGSRWIEIPNGKRLVWTKRPPVPADCMADPKGHEPVLASIEIRGRRHGAFQPAISRLARADFLIGAFTPLFPRFSDRPRPVKQQSFHAQHG